MSIEVLIAILVGVLVFLGYAAQQSAAAEAEARRQAEEEALITMIETMALEHERARQEAGGGCLSVLGVAFLLLLGGFLLLALLGH